MSSIILDVWAPQVTMFGQNDITCMFDLHVGLRWLLWLLSKFELSLVNTEEIYLICTVPERLPAWHENLGKILNKSNS